MLRWIVTYPVDKVIRSLNNWGQVYERTWLGLLLFCLFFFFGFSPLFVVSVGLKLDMSSASSRCRILVLPSFIRHFIKFVLERC